MSVPSALLPSLAPYLFPLLCCSDRNSPLHWVPSASPLGSRALLSPPFTLCPGLISVAGIYTLAKSNLGRKGFCLTSTSTSKRITEASQGRNSGTQTETMEGRCFLTHGLPPYLCSMTHLPRDGTAHSVLGPLTSIINQEKALQTCL